MKKEQMFDIDAVITWVDGNDPGLGAKRAQYMQGNASLQAYNVPDT